MALSALAERQTDRQADSGDRQTDTNNSFNKTLLDLLAFLQVCFGATNHKGENAETTNHKGKC